MRTKRAPAEEERISDRTRQGAGRGRLGTPVDLGRNRIWQQSGANAAVLAGNGTFGSGADGGDATQTPVADPDAIAFDQQGTVYFAEYSSKRIRKILNGRSYQPGSVPLQQSRISRAGDRQLRAASGDESVRPASIRWRETSAVAPIRFPILTERRSTVPEICM